MIYTIQITVEVTDDSLQYCYKAIRSALEHAKMADIVILDMEDTAKREEDDAPWPPERSDPDRERGDDDAVEYADPGDELERRRWGA